VSITQEGIEGEKLARRILKNAFNVDKIFQADWLINARGDWYVVEVKYKNFLSPRLFTDKG